MLAAPHRRTSWWVGKPAAESCDAQRLPRVSAPVVINWDPVTSYHPEFGQKWYRIQVSRYHFFVEGEGVSFSLDLSTDGARSSKFQPA